MKDLMPASKATELSTKNNLEICSDMIVKEISNAINEGNFSVRIPREFDNDIVLKELEELGYKVSKITSNILISWYKS